MTVGPLRRGELLLLAGLVGLVAACGLRWFSVPGAVDGFRTFSTGTAAYAGVGTGWVSRGPSALGHPWFELVVLLGVALLAVLVLSLRARAGGSVSGAARARALAVPLGGVVLVATVVRTVVAPPRLELGRAVGVDLDAGLGAWIGLGSTLVALVGLCVAMRDARALAPGASAGMPPPD